MGYPPQELVTSPLPTSRHFFESTIFRETPLSGISGLVPGEGLVDFFQNSQT